MIFIALEIGCWISAKSPAHCVLRHTGDPYVSNVGGFTLLHVVDRSVDCSLLGHKPLVDLKGTNILIIADLVDLHEIVSKIALRGLGKIP